MYALIERVVDLRALPSSLPAISQALGICTAYVGDLLAHNHARLYMRRRGLVFLRIRGRKTSKIVRAGATPGERIKARVHSPHTSGEIDRALALYLDGAPSSAVERLTGIPKGRLIYWLGQLGLSRTKSQSNHLYHHGPLSKTAHRRRRRIKEVALLHHLSKSEIARRVGISRTTLYKYIKTPLYQALVKGTGAPSQRAA